MGVVFKSELETIELLLTVSKYIDEMIWLRWFDWGDSIDMSTYCANVWINWDKFNWDEIDW